jgi:hypothetical protein
MLRILTRRGVSRRYSYSHRHTTTNDNSIRESDVQPHKATLFRDPSDRLYVPAMHGMLLVSANSRHMHANQSNTLSGTHQKV